MGAKQTDGKHVDDNEMDEATFASFVTETSRALHCLYDPGALRHNALARLLVPQGEQDRAPALRRALLDGIEALKPDRAAPAHSPGWQAHRVLFHRFAEQFGQETVAQELGLSPRQLRRQEKKAIEILAEYLVVHYKLERVHLLPDGAAASTPSREQELAQLQETLPPEPVEPSALLAAVLKTAAPLMRSLSVGVTVALPAELPCLLVPAPLVRQALLNIVIAAAHAAACGPASQIVASGSVSLGRTCLEINVPGPAVVETSPVQVENLAMASELAARAGGQLEFAPLTADTTFRARLLMPAEQSIAVVAIDDNRDTLQLLDRYLTGTCYRFAALADPARAPAMLEAEAPHIIVLDVMLPGIDGWELLGTLRAHPRGHKVPVIVCTILPQETLAAALGAAAFLRKPINRERFLRTLDALVGPAVKESE